MTSRKIMSSDREISTTKENAKGRRSFRGRSGTFLERRPTDAEVLAAGRSSGRSACDLNKVLHNVSKLEYNPTVAIDIAALVDVWENRTKVPKP